MCTFSNINKMAYFYAACTMHVTIFSTGGKFCLVSNYTLLLKVAHSYVLLHTDIETLADITSYLHLLDRTSVFNLGLVLGLDYNRLKTMTDSPSFLEDMLAGWLQKMDQVLSSGVPTWKRLVEALKDQRVGQKGLASKIEWDKKLSR